MKEQRDRYEMLDLMVLPAFCAEDGIVIKVNRAARDHFIASGMALSSLLSTGMEEYRAFTGGCLYLQLQLSGQLRGASVTKLGSADIFLLDPDMEEGELRAMALASRELRQPLSTLTAIVDSLLPDSLPQDDSKATELLARMSRSLYQMRRTLGNMSDAGMGSALSCQESQNLAQVFDDIFEKAGTLLSFAGVTLSYEGLQQDIYGLIDIQQMERAVLNILSNAMKFLPQDGQIRASVVQRGDTLRLSILDTGPGIEDDILASLFSRYLRQPGLEDSRFGLGLGMVLIRSAAISHGGTVLIDQPGSTGTRVTMTMKIRKAPSTQVRTPVTTITTGRDQGLIELADCLPISVYQRELG